MQIPIQVIPLQPDGCHLMITGKVNGLKTNVLLDTGASKTIMDVHRVSHYLTDPEIKAFDKPVMGMGNDKIESWTTSLSEFSIGSFRLSDWPVVLVDLKPINASYAVYDLPRIDMVLGGDLLMYLKAVIDYQNKVFIINMKG